MTITTIHEWEAAIQEVKDLTGALDGTPEQHRLLELLIAIEIWETKYDDSGWNE